MTEGNAKLRGIFDLFSKMELKKSLVCPVTHIVAGLGNPGKEYAHNRHNAGFMALDFISQKTGCEISRAKFFSLTGRTEISGKGVLLLKPQTFMNESGRALREAGEYYGIPPENIIVILDDVSLEPGRMRIRRKGSDGGHNGMKSIIYQLGSDSIVRIKLGVGSPPDKNSMINWVLGDIPKEEQEGFFKCLENTYESVQLILNGEIERAMNIYN